jgi:hypothetical protein
MRHIQYTGPHDSFDASNLLARPDAVFYSPTTQMVPPDMRGNVIKVTNENADELLTYPGHSFVEVEETKAKELTVKQDAARKMREDQRALFAKDSDNMSALGPVFGPSIDAQIAAVPNAVSAVAPAAAHNVRGETASKPSKSRASAPVTDTPADDGTEGGSAFVSTTGE